jgi:hypothetical protein
MANHDDCSTANVRFDALWAEKKQRAGGRAVTKQAAEKLPLTRPVSIWNLKETWSEKCDSPSALAPSRWGYGVKSSASFSWLLSSPPVASTWPSGSVVSVSPLRDCFRLDVGVHSLVDGS